MSEQLLATCPGTAPAPVSDPSAGAPGDAEVARGREALGVGRYDEALEWFDRAALKRPPGDPEVLVALSEALLGQRRYADVARVCRDVLGRVPGDLEARGLLGVALAHLGDPAEALRYLAKAPDRPDVYLAQARAFDQLGSFVEAERSARRASALSDSDPEPLRALGQALAHQRRHGEALSAFARATRLDPSHAPSHLARARLRVALGDPRGWAEMDWRLKVPGLAPDFPPVGPAWDGGPAAGRTLLLIAEPDPGDQFMLVRYASVLKRAGARVVLACRPEMAAVLGRAEGVDRVVTGASALDEPVDAHAHLMSLPARLGAAPLCGPYLRAEPGLAARWGAELSRVPGFKVAVHWAGGAPDRRSIPLEPFAPLSAVPGVRLVAVQTGPGADEARGARFPLVDLGPRLDLGPDAFADTAAVLSGVDLVVTNDSAVAHLAGGLGVPVWVALPVGPDWRWAADRNDSPWYPKMTLFRQARQGDWAGVFNAIAGALRAEVARGSLRPSVRAS